MGTTDTEFLDTFRRHGALTASQLGSHLGITARNVHKRLRRLELEGKVVRVGEIVGDDRRPPEGLFGLPLTFSNPEDIFTLKGQLLSAQYRSQTLRRPYLRRQEPSGGSSPSEKPAKTRRSLRANRER